MKFMDLAGTIKSLLEQEMILSTGAMGMTISSLEMEMIRSMVKVGSTIYLQAGADIEDGGDGIDTIILGPDKPLCQLQ